MPDMCRFPGCPQLACIRVTIENVTVPLCLPHGKNAQANAPRIQQQLQQHEHRAPCGIPECGGRAVKQLYFGDGWINVCARHEQDFGAKLKILRGGRDAQFRPLRTYYREAPKVTITEDP